MDGVVADFAKKWEAMYNTKIDIYTIPPTPDGFYRDLEIIPGSRDAVEVLARRFDVYFLSTAEWDNPSSWTDKRLWIEEKFGSLAKKRLILSPNKSLNMGHYLIDDRPLKSNLAFQGKFIHFGSDQFPNWNSVIKYIFNENDMVIDNYIQEVLG